MRRKIAQGKRNRIMEQTGGACFYCGYAANAVDHLVPHSYNANDSESNLVPVCGVCNSIAGNRHFNNLFDKKEYILAQRETLKWKRRIGRMVVSVVGVSPAPMTMPKEELEEKEVKPKRVKREKVRRPRSNKPVVLQRLHQEPKTVALAAPVNEVHIDEYEDEEEQDPEKRIVDFVETLEEWEFHFLLKICDERRGWEESEKRFKKIATSLVLMRSYMGGGLG